MIRLQRVSKVFGGRALQGRRPQSTSRSRIAKGEFVVLSGASGAGKTTLLRLLYRDELPTEGEIEVAGFDVADAAPRARSRGCGAPSASCSRTPSSSPAAPCSRTSPSCCACSARRAARSRRAPSPR